MLKATGRNPKESDDAAAAGGQREHVVALGNLTTLGREPQVILVPRPPVVLDWCLDRSNAGGEDATIWMALNGTARTLPLK
jgi:hypothetical protein